VHTVSLLPLHSATGVYLVLLMCAYIMQYAFCMASLCPECSCAVLLHMQTLLSSAS
jgi:hypothetical protein